MNEQIAFTVVVVVVLVAAMSFVLKINTKHTMLSNKGELKVNARAPEKERERERERRRICVGQF